MAMNKKEKAQLEDAVQQAAINRALRWSDPDPGPDIPVPSFSDTKLSMGWAPRDYFGNLYGSSEFAFRACSSRVSHGMSWRKTTTQRPIALYSTKLLALRAARSKAEKEFAKILAKIDGEIQKEIESPTMGYEDAF